MGNRFIDLIKAFSETDSDGASAYSIECVFESSSIEDDRDVAEAITMFANEYPYAYPGLEGMLKTVDWLAQSDQAIDAAIEAQYFMEIRDGVDSAVACARMSSGHPEIRPKIERAIESAQRITEAVVSLGMVHELPMEFGRMEPNLCPRYELLEVLGAGAQGAVYLAADRRFEKGERRAMVAVKICRFNLGGEDEATCARAINHPNVARVLDRGVEDENPYIVYELVDGIPLDRWVDKHPHASWRDRCEIIAKIADGVQAAHTSGVIHRDLKPSNILIRPDENPMITDFGVSCKHDDGGAFVYQSRETVLFISPEQYNRTPMSRAPTTDVYALGGLLYWLMVGSYPNGSGVQESVDRLERDEVSSRQRVNGALGPKRLQAVWERALSKDTEARHGTAGQFASDIRSVLDNEPIAWCDTSMAARGPLFLKRNAIPASVSAAAFVMLLGSTWIVASTRVHAELSAAHAVIEQQGVRLEHTQNMLSSLSGILSSQGIDPGVKLGADESP